MASVLIPARCQHTHRYMQLRFEEVGPALWHLVDCLLPTAPQQHGWKTWLRRLCWPAEPLVHIRGTIIVDPTYPGCIHCEAANRYSGGIAKCYGCGNVTCMSLVLHQGVCPTCRMTFTITAPLGNLRGIVAPLPPPPVATYPALLARSVVVQEVPASPRLLPEPGERPW